MGSRTLIQSSKKHDSNYSVKPNLKSNTEQPSLQGHSPKQYANPYANQEETVPIERNQVNLVIISKSRDQGSLKTESERLQKTVSGFHGSRQGSRTSSRGVGLKN
jgi:hypothetical protein